MVDASTNDQASWTEARDALLLKDLQMDHCKDIKLSDKGVITERKLAKLRD